MSNIIWIISTIFIVTFISLTLSALYNDKKIKNDEKSNIIKPNKIFLIVGVVCSIVLLSLVIMAWFFKTSSTLIEKYIFASLIIVFTVSLGGYLIFFYINYKITVYEDYFVYQNFWRKKKTIFYKDIKINNTKIYPQIELNLENGKSKTIFKLAGILDNEKAFTDAYNNWKCAHKVK